LSLAPGKKGWYRCPDIENWRRRFLMEDSKWRNGARSWPKRRFLVCSPLLWLLMQMKPYEKFKLYQKKRKKILCTRY
jgi:hypothetical protein